MLEGQRLIDQALHLTLVTQLQVPKFIDQPIVNILILAESD